MTTPERPSLADTLARIEAVLAEPVALPPCLVCARAALLGEPYCAAHKRIPREMIEELGPVTRDGKAAAPAPPHLPGPPGPTCPGCAADAARPGWLARTLRRLFT